mmetsp:Transcript_50030/g.160047  ORF Transcript_50030/g.160047 Transcript_50030/m.160047 type:complete len:209 (+) Transcript_50030:1900-2526(+)
MEAHLLGSLGRVAHEHAPEHIPHGALDLTLEADDLQSAVQLAARRHDAPRLLHRVLGNRGVHDLVERDDRDAAPQLPPLEQRLARLLVVRDDEEEAAARADLEGPVVGREVRADAEELGHDALHGAAIEAAVGVGVVEVQAAEVRPQVVQAVLAAMQRSLRLLRGPHELLVALRVERELPQLLALIVDDGLRVRPLFEQPPAVLLASR